MNVYLLASYSDLAESGLMSKPIAMVTLKLMRAGAEDKNTAKVIKFIDSNPTFKIAYNFLSNSKHERIEEVLKKAGITSLRRNTILAGLGGTYTLRLSETMAIAYVLEHEADHN